MKQTFPPLMACVLTAGLPLAATAQTTVFNDTFDHGSTLNGTSAPGGTPTASSTSYDIASTKAATTGPAIGSGDLTLKLNSATGSGFLEAQALFTSSPITLATVGDYINMTYVFTDTGGTVLAGGTSSYIFNGLYNSNGSQPLAGSLNNSGLNTTAGSSYATGNAANWQGYVGRIAESGGNNQLFTRPGQSGTGTTSADQDLIGNNLGSGAFNNPSGALLNQVASTASLTSGSLYTVSFLVELTAPGTLAITNALYEGSGTAGAVLASQGVFASGTNYFSGTFDSLAIGLRNSGTSIDPTMDINQITVIDSLQAVPEPGTFALLGASLATLAPFIRRQRK